VNIKRKSKMDIEKYIITFKSTHYAIMSERKLRDYKVEMIPTPREISASCGLSIMFEVEDFNEIIKEVKSWEDYEEMLELYLLNKTTKVAKTVKID